MKAAVFIGAVLCLLAPARGDWYDAHWPYRRALEVNWDSQRASGGELATADFYTTGHDAGTADIRITTADGHLVASRVLQSGQGDWVHMVFALTPGQSHYYVYFGNPNPDAPPAALQDVQYHCGLLMEMKDWALGRPTSGQQIVAQWDNCGPVLASAMINQPFYQEDPISNGPRRVYKLTGTIFSAGTGEYYIAGAAEGYAELCVDGKPALYMPGAPRQDLFHVTLHLQTGRHDFVVYYVRPIDKGEVAISWRLPSMKKLEPIPRTAFGMLGHARPGALEVYGKTLIADFDAQFEGENPIGVRDYTYRYLFSARLPANLAASAQVHFDWDFGDGVTAGGAAVEHVYLTGGAYPVHVTIHDGAASDEQTTRLWVDRERDDAPSEDTALQHGRIVGLYDVTKVPEAWLTEMATLERDAKMEDAEFAAARRLTGISRHAHADACVVVLQQVTEDLEKAGRVKEAVELLDLAPADSDMQPAAAAMESEALIWWVGDFQRALKVSARVADMTDPAGKRAHAEAMALTGDAAAAGKILDDLQDKQTKAGVRMAAQSGAMARNIEYCLDQKDSQTGEEQWDTWEQRCPAVFMEGYSVLLRTELLEERDAGAVAAKIDEAFAAAVPDSPYAPQLLFNAAKLLAKTDPAKSQQLRDLLKSKYPESSLSQH